MKKHALLPIILVLSMLVTACDSLASFQAQARSATSRPTGPTVPLSLAPGPLTPTFFRPMPPTVTFTPSATSTLTPTPTRTPTATPPPTPTATWSFIEAGDVTAPILLYHHVSDETANRYVVPVQTFKEQMQALDDWGYTTITMTLLVDALVNGARLPPRPIVISFDDGNLDIYENAFPIMQEFHFVGVTYIIANRLEARDYVSAKQLKKMIAAGWEVGSHSSAHSDLTANHNIVRYEVLQSRLDLEEALGVPVKTFAYPYGLMDPYVVQKVQDYGYRAAVGLGVQVEHTWSTLYYLSRREVQSDYNMDTFAALLPWTGPLVIKVKPTKTPTPNP
ncbi:MAG: polysaccharide deacetylase family protein [Omnitrophica WOR_2 bacterium]